jgi:HEAT repeat protein
LRDASHEDARNILKRTGLIDEWVNLLKTRSDRGAFVNILKFQIGEGLFSCFKLALEKNRYRGYLKNWIDKNQTSLPLQKIAHSGNGNNFDGKKAYRILINYKEELREMIGDPEWEGRFFALKILLHDDDKTTQGSLIELFGDSRDKVRSAMIADYKHADMDRIKKLLLDIILHDPIPSVRRAAAQRYRRDYGDLPGIEIKKLKVQDTIHLIEAFRPGVKDDEAVATELILDDNLEIRFHAAQYLEHSGTLNRFSSRLDMGDRGELRRKESILKNAASVGVTGFLDTCVETGTRESLLLGATIMKDNGDTDLFKPLLKKAIDRSHHDVYLATVQGIVRRGNLEEKKLLSAELIRNVNNRDTLLELIQAVTPLEDTLFIDPLLRILGLREDLTEATRKALLTKSGDALTHKLIQIIKDENDSWEQQIKIQSIFLLAETKRDYCISFVFEHLPVLPIRFVGQLAATLKRYPKRLLKEKIDYYLDQDDGEIRAHLIALIPKTGITDFTGVIRGALNDADSLVRIASTFALVEMNDSRSLNQALDLLRDPVEEVRKQVAFALGNTGKKTVLSRMARIYRDEHEVAAVKEAIVRGVASSRLPVATDLLVDFLDRDDLMGELIQNELKEHSSDENIRILIERMKDGGKKLKEKISDTFKMMGLEAKPALVHLLESQLSSLKTYASEILDAVGGTEKEIVKLKHRDPMIRREASQVLSLIGTVKAFRGLVMASRDPDREVRINVVKALEKLETAEGKTILKSLESDPDGKIRKYTHWALERLKAKELV